MDKSRNNIIKADLYRHGGLINVREGKKIPGFRFMYYLRKVSNHKKVSFLGIYYRIIFRRLTFKYGYQIESTTSIGEGFYIGHFGTIVINRDVVIGKCCNIAHSTTIGSANRGKLKGCPKIGDKVWIGTGAVIVGNIKVGNNVLIAPNSFVNMDVPDNSLVIGNPAKIIYKENSTEGYINYILEEDFLKK
ncbi:serine acetyltransferase [Algibacter amylolyticus]|uniref:Serine acetyltransferase n=1 Tax=Algibacter amylolyticus TaxID=1608400 RepID=A0A5M7B152_9FLAO|nr:serine acetyltransferase [Algibacter amylolyticus]KAA5820881.1 serine acetyltransferase [Algibacter amylolyticus]MBB5269875.1 serine O-acetyltransferase [Algibacter amylolyticus]TSJ71956.1 serine acetyltransferase [Algibacter amylolyticus]